MKIDYKENIYTLTFNISNVEKVLNMSFLFLFLEVNKNIIDNKIINNNNGFILVKHLFKDMGIKQQYLQINMIHNIEDNCFHIKTQKDLFFNIPNNTEMLDINILIKYIKTTDLNYSFSVTIENINSQINIKDFNLDKIIGKFIIKLFNNLKEYIEENIC
jgi:hypothetical protein